MFDAKELTNQYHTGTLPEGDYYFECGSHIHKGRYINPSEEKKRGAKAYHQYEPVAKLVTFEGLFVGDLKTVTILAPIPEYQDFMALSTFAKGA